MKLGEINTYKFIHFCTKAFAFNRVFTIDTKLAEMAVLASKDLTTAKKLPPTGLDLILLIINHLFIYY